MSIEQNTGYPSINEDTYEKIKKWSESLYGTNSTKEEVVNPDEFVEKAGEKYLHYLGLDWEQMKGKVVVDVGAGAAGFAQAAKKRGIEVVSIDPNRTGWEAQGFHIPNDIYYLDATAQAIPLPDESYDIVVSMGANFEAEEENFLKAIDEELRILKPGGELRVAPLVVGTFFKKEDYFPPEQWDVVSPKEWISRGVELACQYLIDHFPNVEIHRSDTETSLEGYYRLVKPTDK